MRDVAFCTDSFATPGAVAYGERSLACLLWALVFADVGYLLDHPEAPTLYQSGVRWQEEKPQGRTACPEGEGQELFLGIRQVLNQGHADCEDVASWRIAESRLGRSRDKPRVRPSVGHPEPTIIPCPWPMRALGPKVLPAFFKRQVRPGRWVYHIIVFWPGWGFEDPSRVLGMGSRNRYG